MCRFVYSSIKVSCTVLLKSIKVANRPKGCEKKQYTSAVNNGTIFPKFY